MTQSSLFENITTYSDKFHEHEQIGPWQDAFGQQINDFAKQHISPIRTMSLFSGAGGLDVGFHDAGFDIVSAVEIESVFAASLENNIGAEKYLGSNTKVHCTDIRDFNPEYDSVDFIIGGPPCQTFSAAGARAMGVAGTKDARGNLFLEYARLLKTLNPKGFLFENVYRLVGANKGNDWQNIQVAFQEAGYRLFHRVLDTADYGVPQHRERLIIVGLREDVAEEKSFLFPAPTHGPDAPSNLPHYQSGKATHGINDLPEKTGLNGRYGHLLAEIPPGLNYSFFTEKMGHPSPIFAWRSKFSDFLYKADPAKPVRTIKAQGGQYTGPFHWDGRPFSVKELKRLQTFPDSYEILGGRGVSIQQIGNSVPPQFARILALSVIEQVFGYKIPLPLEYISPKQELTFRKRKRELTNHYKKIAKEAIAMLAPSKRTTSNDLKEIRFSISDDFGFQQNDSGDFIAESAMTKQSWRINLRNASACSGNKLAFTIKITPVSLWSLPVNEVILESYTQEENAYTAIWKAFDFLLQNQGFKADLVQLCGYYQYAPAFNAKLIMHDTIQIFENDLLNQTLPLVCSGRVTRAAYETEDLAEVLDIKATEVPVILSKLKSMGYEVRSSGTNLSIGKNTYLIPYIFPTLTPQSVQLRKKL